MSVALLESLPKSRLKALLDHFGKIEDPREPWRVAHPLPEVLLLVVCGTICDCEDYDLIAEGGEEHLAVLRRYLPYHHGVPGGRWLTQLMNRINPGLFAAAFTAWVRASWPDRPEFVAIDGKTSRRSHDRATGTPPLHLVSAFATTARLALGQEAVPDKASETTAIPALIERLAEDDGLKGALVSIDAVAPTLPSPARSDAPAPTTCWPSRPTSPRSAPRSRPCSPRPSRPRLIAPRTSTRGMGASRSAPSLWPAKSTGLRARNAFPARCVCRTWPVWCGAHPAPSWRIAAGSRPATT